MLQVYFNGVPKDVDKRIVWDAELEFANCRLTGGELEATILREIEKARYCDSYSFIDRFGYKLPISDLSTGCKAALLVGGDAVISLYECGRNARDVILNYCSEGMVVLNGDTAPVEYRMPSVAVRVEDTICETVDDINAILTRR